MKKTATEKQFEQKIPKDVDNGTYFIKPPVRRDLGQGESRYKCPSCKKEHEIKPTYKCTSCGKTYTKQSGNFAFSQSPFFQANNGYITVCKNCLDYYENEYTEKFSDNEKAVERLCLHFDLYAGKDLLYSATKSSKKQNKLVACGSKLNLAQWVGKTYDTYLFENSSATIDSIEEYQQLQTEGKTGITKAAIQRWGVGGFDEDAYEILDAHYKMLKSQNPNCNSNQEIFIKDLCLINLQRTDAIKGKKTDDFKKLTELYQQTFSKAGLKTVIENDSSNDETLGVTLATISQYTPEEYYKDKTLYKDFDGIGEYINRFITRPLKNLITGSNDRDGEYNVEDK